VPVRRPKLRERILIVDDKPSVCRHLSTLLGRHGWDVEYAHTAETALRLASRRPFSLALIDLQLPGRNGLRLLKEVRQHHPEVRVIMLITRERIAPAVQCFRAGAVDYLVKPVAEDELVFAVARTLHERVTTLELDGYRTRFEEKLREEAEHIRSLFLGSIQALALSLEAKDPYARGHSERVAYWAREVGRKMGLPADGLELLDLAGQLHDIGKIGVRETIFHKPGRLTDDEWAKVQLHPRVGTRILRPVIPRPALLDAVLYHHEGWDGSGYPEGLKGHRIPLPAQILKACDMYEALTSERSYRPAFAPDEARATIREEAGTTISPDIARALLTLTAQDHVLPV